MAGLSLGLAELAKMTWIVLYPVYLVLGLVCGIRWDSGDSTKCVGSIAQLGLILGLAMYVTNLGYGFEGTCLPLKEYRFSSRLLAGSDVASDQQRGNLLATSALRSVAVPFPRNYILGIDLQRRELEHGKWSYLLGEHRFGGWWYYYTYALFVKEPIGTWMLAGLACGAMVLSGKYRLPWRDELCLAVPALAVLLLVSSQTGFNRYHRYVLPCLPFLFISVSRIAKSVVLRHSLTTVAAVVALGWSGFNSLSVYPFSHSYFNEWAGGPLNGPRHLLDANIDWGQDLLVLKKWIDEHPNARPIAVACTCAFDPWAIGIPATKPPQGPRVGAVDPSCGPLPGWYAVGVNPLYGYPKDRDDSGSYTYFQKFKPIDYVGYSIYIFHITIEDANRVRRELGLPVLDDQIGEKSRPRQPGAKP